MPSPKSHRWVLTSGPALTSSLESLGQRLRVAKGVSWPASEMLLQLQPTKGGETQPLAPGLLSLVSACRQSDQLPG